MVVDSRKDCQGKRISFNGEGFIRIRTVLSLKFVIGVFTSSLGRRYKGGGKVNGISGPPDLESPTPSATRNSNSNNLSLSSPGSRRNGTGHFGSFENEGSKTPRKKI